MRIALAVLAILGTPALAQSESETQTVIVTGKPLKDTEAALRDCIKRKCPTDEDIRLTLQHAENQFVSGSYRDARYTLARSIGRNGGEGKRFPVEVSDLWRANGRIGAHLGEADIYRMSTLEMRDALKAGLPKDDERVLASSIEIGDMRARLGFPDEAERIYARVAEDARARGKPTLAGYADLRGAWLDLQRDVKAEPRPDLAKRGRAKLAALAAKPASEVGRLGFAARVLLARLDRLAGDESATARILEDYAKAGGTTRPTLLFAAPIEQPDDPYGNEQGQQRNVLSQLASKDFEERWVDIGFFVTPKGRVSDAEIVRGSHKDIDWTKPVFAAINSRIYAPLRLEEGDPGAYRIERYTYTSYMEERTGTRIRRRSARPRIEQIDLTPEQIASGAPPSGTSDAPLE